jgi:hypothetical protein
LGFELAKGQAAMKWEPPAFVEINMSAEIGGYQSDFSDRDPREPTGSGQLPVDARSTASHVHVHVR